MKLSLLMVTTQLTLAGCGLGDFADKQAAWNRQHGMSSMNPGSSMGSPGSGDQAAKDAETQRNIKQGEDLETEEARKAGFGPSPMDGMNCTTASSFTGSSNSGTSSSRTSCHN
jgi:hypothetical protein